VFFLQDNVQIYTKSNDEPFKSKLSSWFDLQCFCFKFHNFLYLKYCTTLHLIMHYAYYGIYKSSLHKALLPKVRLTTSLSNAIIFNHIYIYIYIYMCVCVCVCVCGCIHILFSVSTHIL